MDNDRFQPVDMRRISHSELLAMIAQGKTPVPNSATLDGQTSYDCPHCRDTGRVTVIERHHGVDCEVSYRCKYCWEKREYMRLLRASGMGDAFSDKVFDNFKPWNREAAMARATAMRYAIEFDTIEHSDANSLALLGTVGAGKTMLGCCVLNELLSRNIGVRYTKYGEMMQKLKQNAMDEEAYNRHLGNYVNARVLFIDDLFKDSRTQADLNHLYKVIDGRYFARRPMIITSEMTIDQLADIDLAIGSRIAERCSNYAFTFLSGREGNYRLRGLI